MKSFLICFAVLTLLVNWGCARRPAKLEKPERISTQELVTKLRTRSAHWKDYQAKLSIKGESPKGKFRFRSVILSRLPAAVRLEAYTLWGQTAALMIIDNETSELWIPSEKVIYTADRGEDLVRYFLGVPLPVDVLGYSLIASVPPALLNGWQIRRDSTGWLATAESGRQHLRFTWKFTNAPPALQSVSVRDRYSEYSVVYDPPVDLDVKSCAQNINFLASRWNMEISVSGLQVPSQMQPTVFEMPVPEGVRRIKLD